MKWVLNGETIAKNFKFFEYKGFYKFRWKWFPQSWSFSEREIYIDLSYLKKKLIKEIGEYNNGKKHHSYTTLVSYEFEDDYGNYRCSDFPIYEKHYYDDTNDYVAKLRDKLENLFSKDIFFIKKISNNGCGWGIFISREDFIRRSINGYYRD